MYVSLYQKFIILSYIIFYIGIYMKKLIVLSQKMYNNVRTYTTLTT